MFILACVILFTGGKGVTSRDLPTGGLPSGGSASKGPASRGPASRGVPLGCLHPGILPSGSRVFIRGEGGVMGIRKAGGIYHTGLLSCFIIIV